ncbi:endolytic transglycosylase MltG [Acidicapsa ligni]|uniref:endolytic transglycosylase MltG n=1 Tax=Acidicapsa ligni TaxID=542300 RepID=UPI0021E0B31E|nr:endolytic transglycosylase MltG [Acidicapsa ligni]
MVRRRSTRKKKSSGASSGLFLFVLLVVLVGTGAGAWFVYLPAGPNTETFVEIAPGSSSAQIALQLERYGIIRSRYGFDLVRLWKRGILKAGEYRFDHPVSVPEVYARIARGDVFTVAVTIPEGANRFEVAARIAQAGLGNKEDFLAATVKDTSLVADLDPHANTVEGYLYPDTYRFPRKATPTQIISTMVRRFRTVANQIGLRENMHSVVTLASLVERETAVNAERPLVASVLSNRLSKNMPLMTDPAIIYGLETEGKWRGAIYESDLVDPKHDTAYNTYHHKGLPPGPIANPGQPSLRAALHPADTDYLYFVAAGADPQGKSRFASTLDEHNKNVASYRQAVKQAGGH